MTLKLIAIQCKLCLSILISRARHDFHSCVCKAVSIDGYSGGTGLRMVGNPDDMIRITFSVEGITSWDLYWDYYYKRDQFKIGIPPTTLQQSEQEKNTVTCSPSILSLPWKVSNVIFEDEGPIYREKVRKFIERGGLI